MDNDNMNNDSVNNINNNTEYGIDNNNTYNNNVNINNMGAPADMSAPYSTIPPVKKKGKYKFLILAALIVIVLAVAAVANASGIKNFFRKTFMSSEDYYRSIEKDDIDTAAAILSNQYDDIIYKLGGIDNKACNLNMNLKVEDAASSYIGLIGAATGVKLDWLKQADVTATATSIDGKYGLRGNISINENNIAGFDTLYEADKKMAYAAVPELSSKYMGFTDNTGVDYKGIVKIIDALMRELPDKSVIEKLIRKYGYIIVDNLDNIEKNDASLNAGNVSENCSEYKVTVNQEKLKNIIIGILGELEKDDDIKQLFVKNYESIKSIISSSNIDIFDKLAQSMSAMTGEQMYSAFILYLGQLRSELDESNNNVAGADLNIVMSVYIDGSGRIIGRNVSIGDATFDFKMPFDGRDYALECSFDTGKTGMNMNCSGSGKISGDKLSGDFSVSLSGLSYGNMADDVSYDISLEDVDLSDTMNGYFNGRIRYDLGPVLKQAGAAALDGLILDMYISGTREGGKADIALFMHDSKLVTLTIDAALSEAEDISFPSDNDVINADGSNIREWLSTVKLDGLISSLESVGVDESIIKYIRQINDLLSLGLIY